MKDRRRLSAGDREGREGTVWRRPHGGGAEEPSKDLLAKLAVFVTFAFNKAIEKTRDLFVMMDTGKMTAAQVCDVFQNASAATSGGDSHGNRPGICGLPRADRLGARLLRGIEDGLRLYRFRLEVFVFGLKTIAAGLFAFGTPRARASARLPMRFRRRATAPESCRPRFADMEKKTFAFGAKKVAGSTNEKQKDDLAAWKKELAETQAEYLSLPRRTRNRARLLLM